MMFLPQWISLKVQKQISFSQKSSHMGLTILCLGCRITSKYIWLAQLGTPFMFRDISCQLIISCRIVRYSPQPRNWLCLTSIPCSVQRLVLCSCIYDVMHNNPQFDRYYVMNIKNWCTIKYLS